MADDIRSMPRGKTLLEVPTYTWNEWESVGLVKAAIRGIENGQFDSASLVVDAMTRDDRLGGCLSIRTEALPTLPMTFEAAKGAGGEECSKWTEANWKKMFSDAAVSELHHWGCTLGLGIGQNVWTNEKGEPNIVDGKLVPRLKVWHPRFAYWRWDTRSYWISTTTGVSELKHGDGQWVLYAPYGTDRAYMKGRVRQLYVPWLIRQWGLRDWARYSEVHGLPIRKAKVPAGAQKDDKDRYLREIASIGSESVVLLPHDQNGVAFDLEMLEASGTGYEGFDRLLAAANVNIAVNILGQNLTTEVESGSLAAAGVHERIANNVLKKDGSSMVECLTTGTVEIAAELNFGAKAAAPKSSYKTDPPEDKKIAGDAMVAVGDGINALVNAGLPVDGDKLAERFGIPLLEGKKYEARDPAPNGSEPEPGVPGAPKPKPGAKPKAAKKLDRVDPITGQLYIDRLDDNARHAAELMIKPDLAAIGAAIEAAESYDDLKQRLVKLYGAMSETDLEGLMSMAFRLAEMNGRHSVREEVTDDA